MPVDARAVFETLAAEHGGGVVVPASIRSPSWQPPREKGVRLSGDGHGRSIFPQLHAVYDAMFSLVKLLELLARQRITLDQVVDSLPEWHVKDSSVACPWDKRGRVMRLLGEQYRDRRLRAADGIKMQLETTGCWWCPIRTRRSSTWWQKRAPTVRHRRWSTSTPAS